MNAKTLIRFATGLAALALLAGIPVAGAGAPEQGKLSLGVALPQVHLGQGADAAEPLRQSLMNRLRSAGVDPVALTGSSPAEIDAEAKGKGCSHVLYIQLEQQHGGGSFFSKLAPLARVLPAIAGAGVGGGGGGGGGVTGVLTQAAASAATDAAASAAQQQIVGAQLQVPNQTQGLETAARASIKRGDSIALDYRLATVGGGAPFKSETLRAKAESDGQDILTPLAEQLATAVSPALQAAAGIPQPTGGPTASGAAGGVPSAGPGQPEHSSPWSGLFGAHNRTAGKPTSATASTTAGGMPDCAQIAGMPNPPISLEACQKMAAAQQAYDRAAADPGASRPGDEQLSCDQIAAELRLQQYSAPDKAKAAAATAAATQEQALLNKHMAEANAVMAEEQVKVDAAVAADRVAEVATGGLVRPNAASAAAEAAQARVKVVGERQAAERRPTEQKLIGGVADLGMDAAQQLTSNPRLARLMQLAQAHGCKGT